jgi:hypothetical protein
MAHVGDLADENLFGKNVKLHVVEEDPEEKEQLLPLHQEGKESDASSLR